MAPRGQCTGDREPGIDRMGPIEVFQGLPIRRLGHFQYGVKRLCCIMNRDRIALGFALDVSCLQLSQASRHGAGHRFRYASFQFRGAFDRALERIAPDLTPCRNVDQPDDRLQAPTDALDPAANSIPRIIWRDPDIIGRWQIAFRRQHVEPSRTRQCRDYLPSRRRCYRIVAGFRVHACERMNDHINRIAYGMRKQWQRTFAGRTRCCRRQLTITSPVLLGEMAEMTETMRTGDCRYVSFSLAVAQGETHRLQPQMAVEFDGRLSSESLELSAQRAFGRPGGCGDFAGSERLGKAPPHEPDGHHDGARGRTVDRHRYICSTAGCLILSFPDSGVLPTRHPLLWTSQEHSHCRRALSLRRHVRHIVCTPRICRGHGSPEVRSGKGGDPTPLFPRARPPRSAAAGTTAWWLAGSLRPASAAASARGGRSFGHDVGGDPVPG